MTTIQTPPHMSPTMKPARRFSDSSGLHTAETWGSSSDDEDSFAVASNHNESNHNKRITDLLSSLAAKDRHIDELTRALDVTHNATAGRDLLLSLDDKNRCIDELSRAHHLTNTNEIESTPQQQSWSDEREESHQEHVQALQKKVAQTEQLLKMALADKQALEERSHQQQRQIEQLLQQQQQQAPQTTGSTTKEQPQHSSETDDIDDDNDSQVRDQIAAVKASLQQGSHQAKANQASITEELETCRRLQEKLAHRKDFQKQHAATRTPPMSPNTVQRHPNNNKAGQPVSLQEQLAAMVASVQEREEYMAEIAQSFQKQKDAAAKGTIPVSLYQAEIQQWKEALEKLAHYSDNAFDDQDGAIQETLRQSNHLLQQANDKLHQLESALAMAQQESNSNQERAQVLFQVVQKLEQDKEEEIHLLDIVMEHLIGLEEEQGQM